jgi:hypothetical protein
LGAVLDLESKKGATAGSHTQNAFDVDGKFLSNFQELRLDLEKVNGNQMHRSDLDDLELHILCGAIRSDDQLQIHLLNTTAKTCQKQMEGLVESFPASQHSLKYFALVSFLIERYAPIDHAQSARDTIAHIGSALRHLRKYFSSAIPAVQPLKPVEMAAEVIMLVMLLLFIALSNVATSERPALSVQASSLDVLSFSGPDSEPPSLTSSPNSSPGSLSPATPTFLESPKSCDMCGQIFASDEGTPGRIKRHLMSSCPNQDPSKKGKLRCSSTDCTMEFSRSDSRLTHERKKHPHLNRSPKRGRVMS